MRPHFNSDATSAAAAMLPEHFALIAAPMVNQSDLPFRILVQKYGASLTFTQERYFHPWLAEVCLMLISSQMLMPDRLLNDQDYLQHHIRDLSLGADELTRPVVVQLCGNDVETIVQAGRKLQAYCDGMGE
jgi:tRNA-dihydrouridine synthase 1